MEPEIVHELQRSVGTNLRSRRDDLDYTQQVLGDMVGKTRQTIRGIEQGAISPSLETIALLANALDMPPAALFPTYKLGEGRQEDRSLIDAISKEALLLDERDRLVVLTVIKALLDAARTR